MDLLGLLHSKFTLRMKLNTQRGQQGLQLLQFSPVARGQHQAIEIRGDQRNAIRIMASAGTGPTDLRLRLGKRGLLKAHELSDAMRGQIDQPIELYP